MWNITLYSLQPKAKTVYYFTIYNNVYSACVTSKCVHILHVENLIHPKHWVDIQQGVLGLGGRGKNKHTFVVGFDY